MNCYRIIAIAVFCFVAESSAFAETQAQQLVDAAIGQIGKTVYYDGSYQRISYPGGDIPFDRGVCTDVLVRAYRVLGIDLQELVHNDMKRAFSQYPANWGLSKPDSNIDHLSAGSKNDSPGEPVFSAVNRAPWLDSERFFQPATVLLRTIVSREEQNHGTLLVP